MQKTWTIKVDVPSDREWLDEKWKKEFKNKAEVIIGVKYDFQKIKHNKALVQVWENEVNLELTKALVHITGRFCLKDNEKCRKHVDELTLALGVPYSALGWELFAGNKDPKKKGKKRKETLKVKWARRSRLPSPRSFWRASKA